MGTVSPVESTILALPHIEWVRVYCLGRGGGGAGIENELRTSLTVDNPIPRAHAFGKPQS